MNVSSSNTSTRERILLIGGSGGIGRALGRALRARGAELVLAARDPARLESAAAELDAEGHALDATRMEDVMSLVARVAAERPLTGLVNLAGAILLKPAHRTSEAEWQHVLRARSLPVSLAACGEMSEATRMQGAAPPEERGVRGCSAATRGAGDAADVRRSHLSRTLLGRLRHHALV